MCWRSSNKKMIIKKYECIAYWLALIWFPFFMLFYHIWYVERERWVSIRAFMLARIFQHVSYDFGWLFDLQIWPLHHILFIILLLGKLFSLNGVERVIRINIFFIFAFAFETIVSLSTNTVLCTFIHLCIIIISCCARPFFYWVCLPHIYTCPFARSLHYNLRLLVRLLHAACIYVLHQIAFHEHTHTHRHSHTNG